MRRPICLLAATLLLQGCASTLYNVPSGASDEQRYAALFPYYVEFCAVSEIRKRPGSPVDVEGGGPGGHSVLYLNGVCKDHGSDYPVIAVCNGAPSPDQGVGISVNAHYRNANWTATEGRNFFLHGDLVPGEALTEKAYARTQAAAKRQGVLNGIVFYDDAMKNKPASISARDYMYEMSVATDYAIAFGRDRYCARVPIDRRRMQGVVTYLNSVNAPYRSGEREFHWDVLRDNCAHLTHNVLATVGVWRHWPTERPLLIAAFDFPVPKNEFVNLMRRTNDLPIEHPNTIMDNDELRDALLNQDWIATRPGGLAEAERAVPVNALYDTNLRLIFYDEEVFGHYQQRFEQEFHEPRYMNLSANFKYFASKYSEILAQRPKNSDQNAAFYDHIVREQKWLQSLQARLR